MIFVLIRQNDFDVLTNNSREDGQLYSIKITFNEIKQGLLFIWFYEIFYHWQYFDNILIICQSMYIFALFLFLSRLIIKCKSVWKEVFNWLKCYTTGNCGISILGKKKKISMPRTWKIHLNIHVNVYTNVSSIKMLENKTADYPPFHPDDTVVFVFIGNRF